MSDRVSSRHEGDLGGHFLPFGDGKSARVTVAVDPNSAMLPSVQHAAWMLINLLARFDGIVEKVGLRCPPGVQLNGRIVPLASNQYDLRTALITGANAIDVVPVALDEQYERTLVVGIGGPAHAGAALYVCGNAWCGGISDVPVSGESVGSPSALPFGPYVAACIAAGEVFKAARMKADTYILPPSTFYSLWHYEAAKVPLGGGPSEVTCSLNAALAGVGAVGCALIHALWACEGLDGVMHLVDNDRKGLEGTNLNRYALFGRGSVGKFKATEAAQIAEGTTIRWKPHDVGIESLYSLPPRVISAVDRNASRQAIQNRYPARILSGSTLDLRAEVLRCGPPGVGACLRCYNPPEKIAPDADLREQLLHASDEKIAALAAAVGVTVHEAREWAKTGQCGLPGERLLRQLRDSDGEIEFAVSFVSVMAGTMLAAEFIKDHMACDGALSDSAQRAVFQFHSPWARSNCASAFSRDPACPMCDPATIACRAWVQRYEFLKPVRK